VVGQVSADPAYSPGGPIAADLKEQQQAGKYQVVSLPPKKPAVLSKVKAEKKKEASKSR
jgi:hypothetical protein